MLFITIITEINNEKITKNNAPLFTYIFQLTRNYLILNQLILSIFVKFLNLIYQINATILILFI